MKTLRYITRFVMTFFLVQCRTIRKAIHFLTDDGWSVGMFIVWFAITLWLGYAVNVIDPIGLGNIPLTTCGTGSGLLIMPWTIFGLGCISLIFFVPTIGIPLFILYLFCKWIINGYRETKRIIN